MGPLTFQQYSILKIFDAKTARSRRCLAQRQARWTSLPLAKSSERWKPAAWKASGKVARRELAAVESHFFERFTPFLLFFTFFN